MINITFKKDYSKDFNVKFYGLVRINIIYKNGKVVSIKEKNKPKELLEKIQEFKEFYGIKTDDVITIVDMYFENKFNLEYIGKPIF
jgi:hypothetical protein